MSGKIQRRVTESWRVQTDQLLIVKCIEIKWQIDQSIWDNRRVGFSENMSGMTISDDASGVRMA
jgi:hypothetical protein